MIHRTEADLIHAMHEARHWFERNRHRFRYHLPERDDRTWEGVFDELLDLLTTPVHLALLSEAFDARMLPETPREMEGWFHDTMGHNIV